MNVSEANAVNTVARALTGTPSPFTGETPTVEETQSAIDLLLGGAYRKLAAGLRPGDTRVLPSIGSDS